MLLRFDRLFKQTFYNENGSLSRYEKSLEKGVFFLDRGKICLIKMNECSFIYELRVPACH
jgi:hypothetical protein